VRFRATGLKRQRNCETEPASIASGYWKQLSIYCQTIGKQLLLLVVETTLEKNILKTLVELDAAVKAMPSANPKLDLLKLFARIDELAQALPRDADPILLHYLHKKSYQKARLFLQGREAENAVGNCRHVN